MQVRIACGKELPILLLHECDALRGGCDFLQILEGTPEDLIREYGLYKQLAIPRYASKREEGVTSALALKFLASCQGRQMTTVVATLARGTAAATINSVRMVSQSRFESTSPQEQV
mmetsp:Transcript_35317/g.58504  ORF Transcript_35317/g.58504 Transcript_35317/m.58504 type:complete len:116 (-) Transcript_35317:420-767(-)